MSDFDGDGFQLKGTTQIPSFGEPLVESIGVAGKFLAETIVVLLALGFLQQFLIALGDDLLQVAPRVLQGFHGEPRVRIGSHFETLDLGVEGCQRFEIHLGRRQ